MPSLGMTNEAAQRIGVELMAKPPKRKRGPVPVKALAHEDLFVLLTTLRAANAESLIQLFFREQGIPRRTAMRRLAALLKGDYLGRVRLDGARWVYHLTAKALDLTPRLRLLGHATLCVPPPHRQAVHCWLRSALWASLTKDGYTVGQSATEHHALRRFNIDTVIDRYNGAGTTVERDALNRTLQFLRASDALMVSARRFRCRACDAVVVDAGVLKSDVNVLHDANSCGGALRETSVVPYDVAWRKNGDRYEVILLVVDNPSRSIEAQLDELPFVCFGQPSLPVILRSTDPGSRYVRKAKRWATVGQRRAELVKAFGEKGKGDSVILLDYRPELQAYCR